MDQPDWMQKLHFMVDMVVHLDMLNKSMQGKESMALQMLEKDLAFEHKMAVFATDVQRGTLHHFSFLKKVSRSKQLVKHCVLLFAIVDIQTAFPERFCDFRMEKTCYLFPSLLWSW